MSIQRWPSNNDPWAKGTLIAVPSSPLPRTLVCRTDPELCYIVRDADGQAMSV